MPAVMKVSMNAPVRPLYRITRPGEFVVSGMLTTYKLPSGPKAISSGVVRPPL